MPIKKLITGLSALMLPSCIARWVLNLLGHRIDENVRFGVSFICADSLHLQKGVRVGHFNFVLVRRLVMRRGSCIGRSNLIHGPFSINLREKAAIGNRNKILRGRLGLVVSGPALFALGKLSKITSDHRVDCTATVSLGNYSILAGTSTELWSHGYVHDQSGPGRYRIDGPVRIGHNVYIGSACVITAGVTIADGVIVGAGTTVARSLLEPGLYVSAGLRKLERPPSPDERPDLSLVKDEQLCERVYTKRPLD
jgi:acetyltransferase-like isoleucine patch superfamily enzyme